MSDLQIPYSFIEIINGEEWYFLAKTLAWLKKSELPIQINPYKRRCSPLNMIKHRVEGDKGKSKVYVNKAGLIEIVERTRAIKADTKRLLGITSGVTSSESMFESFLDGIALALNIKVERQVALGDYRIDFVINGKLAVEFDELTHASYSEKRESLREREIERAGYKILRVKDSDNFGYSLGLIIKEVDLL
jgi:very-short-patch-repair endonuclease